MDEKTLNIYRNLSNQIDKVFRHTRQGSIKTRHRYEDGMNHFAKFLAETFKKQNLNKIENKHLLWIPGGYTSGNVPEAITDIIPLNKTIISRVNVE
ncbi:hypothetical protein ACQPU1_17995 [Clostridium paraputrificum]|uniref:hypothetical protein n=1 Tax=Clostridium paraputrificum TaxID=29363 RepID=UPI003D329C61